MRKREQQRERNIRDRESDNIIRYRKKIVGAIIIIMVLIIYEYILERGINYNQ